jgi:hypothetical protein
MMISPIEFRNVEDDYVWHTMQTHPADAIRHVIVTAAVVHDGPVVAITNHNSTDSHMKISRIPQRCAGIVVGPQCPAFMQSNQYCDRLLHGLSRARTRGQRGAHSDCSKWRMGIRTVPSSRKVLPKTVGSHMPMPCARPSAARRGVLQ